MKRSLSGALALALASSAALAACSAGDNSGGANETNSGTGSTPGGGDGFGAFGNSLGAGGDGSGSSLNVGGTGSTSGGGGGSNVGGGSGITTPQNIDRCNATDAAKFGGGAGPGGLAWLYPYNGTVFPRGIAAPTLMWSGGSADAVMVEIKSAKFTYRECFGATNPLRIQVPQDAWDGAGLWSGGPGDPTQVTVSVVSGGTVNVLNEQVLFALATMKGAVYYNTYDSALAAHNGAVLKTLPSAAAPTVFLTEQGLPPLGPCISCHALSANGATMTANRHLYPGSYESRGYDVASGTPVQVSAGIPEAGFAGIYPDGSRLITNGPPNVSASAFFPTASGNVTALIQSTSKMLDITGNPIPATGWDGVVPHAQMPMFSPLGNRIVYNDYDKGAGHSLWVADFDPGTNTFSNHRQIFTDGQRYPSWPFFTPDGLQVVFALGTNSDYTSQVPGVFGPGLSPNQPLGRGLLMTVDVASGTAVALDLANGFAGGGSYLPHNDNDYEYFTTVSPVAGGGFYWALFTSRREFGNIWNVGKEDPKAKKIWVTAISIGAPAGTDPSHPAFLLPGQEIDSGNMRAFAALEPCKEDGRQCSSGTECCSGYCTNIDPTTGIGICGIITVNECAKLDNKCDTDADCCTGADNGAAGRLLRCLGGFCGEIFQ